MRRTFLSQRFVLGTAALLGLCFVLDCSHVVAERPSAGASEDKNRSLQAFAPVASVLRSPRCLNCHIPGESPLQGDDGKPHNMNVKRGPDGRGTPAMRCENCHQSQNSSTPHSPPGARNWRLPPPATPMAWQGLGIGDLCRTLKDPAKNGGRTLPQVVEHFETEQLVLWAWNPGPGRVSPSISHDEFVAKVKEWIETGAACAQ
jgi:hypothetical protein